MAKDKTRFYNMLIRLIKGDNLFEENVAIKNIWQKEGNIFLDIYFYSQQKSYVFDAVFVHDLMDLTNERVYKDINDFVEDFTREDEPETEEAKEPSLSVDKNIFQPIYLDLVIMSFFANRRNDKLHVKKKIIAEYIKQNIPSTANMSEQYLDAYIEGLKPGEGEFYAALQGINSKDEDDVAAISKEIIKICLADGRLHYTEKMYLAEFMQVLREHGISVDLGE